MADLVQFKVLYEDPSLNRFVRNSIINSSVLERTFRFFSLQYFHHFSYLRCTLYYLNVDEVIDTKITSAVCLESFCFMYFSRVSMLPLGKASWPVDVAVSYMENIKE